MSMNKEQRSRLLTIEAKSGIHAIDFKGAVSVFSLRFWLFNGSPFFFSGVQRLPQMVFQGSDAFARYG